MSRTRTGIDALLAQAGIDPARGVQVAAASRVAGIAFDPTVPTVLLRGGEVSPPLPGRHARPGALAALATLYPPDHQVVRLPGGERMRLSALDESTLLGADWLVPSLDPIDNHASPHGIAAISARLRAPDGCPWDRRQTHRSLRPYLLEEAYETVDAIENGTPADLAEELGDLLLQVVLHAQFAAEVGAFDLTDVYRSIATKIVRRHPHVFGDVVVDGVEGVASNWEVIKADERAERGKGGEDAFAGVVRALPALPASREIQDRAASLGWDWDAVEGVWDKVSEELDELRVAGDDHELLHEVGDVLFALVNLSRWLKVDPEEALRAANQRWVDRYRRVERLAAQRGIELEGLTLAEKDVLWDEVKAR